MANDKLVVPSTSGVDKPEKYERIVFEIAVKAMMMCRAGLMTRDDRNVTFCNHQFKAIGFRISREFPADILSKFVKVVSERYYDYRFFAIFRTAPNVYTGRYSIMFSTSGGEKFYRSEVAGEDTSKAYWPLAVGVCTDWNTRASGMYEVLNNTLSEMLAEYADKAPRPFPEWEEMEAEARKTLASLEPRV